MKTTETLDRDNLAAANGLNRIVQGRVVRGEHITGRLHSSRCGPQAGRRFGWA